MNTTNPAHGFAAPASTTPGPTRRVVDAPTRMFHWLFALCFTLAYVTADGERWRLVHVTLGYTLAGLLAFRLCYGLIGPRQARLSLLWRKLAGLPAWLRSLQPGMAGDVNWRQGQNLLMALAVAALMAVVLPVAISGYATYKDWGGEWLAELHEFTGELFLWLVLGHLALILGLSPCCAARTRRSRCWPDAYRVPGRTSRRRTMAHWPYCCWPPCWPSGPGNGNNRLSDHWPTTRLAPPAPGHTTCRR